MKRTDEELTNRVFLAQINDPCPGDFGELIKEDFATIDVPFDLSFVENTAVGTYRKLVKTKVSEAAFKYLKNVQKTHSKAKDIEYQRFEVQPYLKSNLFSNEESCLLFALRSRTAESFKSNFRHLYGGKVDCNLQCWDQDEIPPEDSQQHLLCCPKVKVDSSNITCNIITYEDIFGNVKRQKEAITLFTHLLEIKNKEINKQSPPGEKLDLSTS